MDFMSPAFLLTALTSIVTLAGSWFVVRYKVGDLIKSKNATSIKLDEMHKTIELNAKRTEEIRSKSAHELGDFKLQVAKEYSTNDAVHHMEERVIEEIKSLREVFLKAVSSNNYRG